MNEDWGNYRSIKFPRRAALLQRALGQSVSVEVDWKSLGECTPRNSERLGYDLEMLARGLEGARRDANKSAAVSGISRVALRWVDGIEDCVFGLEAGTLQVSYCSHGAFGADEVEALLRDRELTEFNQYVSPAPPSLSPALQDLRKHRLPALFQALQNALGKPVHIDIDWASLGHGYEAPPRLLYLLKETACALRGLSDCNRGMVVGPPSVQAREKRLAEARSAGVRKGVLSLRISGAMKGQRPPVEIQGGQLQLNVFIDPTTSAQGKLRPDYDLRVIDSCKHRAIETVIADALGLRVNPYLEQIRGEDAAKLQPYLARILDDAITGARGLRVPERVALRSKAGSGPLIHIDFESFLLCGDPSQVLTALKSLETGHYNYNCDSGTFATAFFQALKECVSDSGFLTAFVEHVKSIRLQCVASSAQKEFGVAAGTLLIKQCPCADTGMLDGDLSGALKALVAMLESGSLAQPEAAHDESALEDQFAVLGAQLIQAFGSQLSIDFDPSICNSVEEAHMLSQRGILPVLGAVKLLLEKPGVSEELPGALARLRFLRDAHASVRVTNRELLIQAAPENGPSGWPDSEQIAAAINEGLALQARAGIRERERESREGWQSMLRERFDRDVTLHVDWNSFLAHPDEGGNRFYPFYLEEAGIRTLLYALTGYMDEDAKFKSRAKDVIDEIQISSANDSGSISLTLSRGILQYRCHANMSPNGYLQSGHLQERLYSLAFPTAGR